MKPSRDADIVISTNVVTRDGTLIMAASLASARMKSEFDLGTA